MGCAAPVYAVRCMVRPFVTGAAAVLGAVGMVLGLTTPASASHALKPKPLWEAGIGAGAAWYPTYPGGVARKRAAAGAPYIIYRGRYLRASGRSISAVLYESPRTWIDLGGSGWLPVDSSDEPARAGMPDLDATVQVGPRYNRLLVDRPHLELLARLPVRGVWSADNHVLDLSHRGYAVEPALKVSAWPGAGRHGHVKFTLTLAALWGSAECNGYFYDVPPAFATPSRPAFSAGSGWTNFSARAAASWYITDRVRVGGFIHSKFLSGTAVADSPLAVKNAAATLGVGLTWVFAVSERTVTGRHVDNGAAD